MFGRVLPNQSHVQSATPSHHKHIGHLTTTRWPRARQHVAPAAMYRWYRNDVPWAKWVVYGWVATRPKALPTCGTSKKLKWWFWIYPTQDDMTILDIFRLGNPQLLLFGGWMQMMIFLVKLWQGKRTWLRQWCKHELFERLWTYFWKIGQVDILQWSELANTLQ